MFISYKIYNVGTFIGKLCLHEFIEKTRILIRFYEELSPMAFYDILFNDSERNYVYVLSTTAQRKGTCKVAKSFDELQMLAVNNSVMATPPATFYGDYLLKKTLKQMYSFVVDIDYVSSNALSWIIKKLQSNYIKIKPTAIVNSGNGIHLYYILDEPVECYKYRIKILEEIKKKIQDLWRSNQYKVDDNTNLIQSYRVVGSLDKNFNTSEKSYRLIF